MAFIFREEHRFPEVLPDIVQCAFNHVVAAVQIPEEEKRNTVFFKDIKACFRLLGHAAATRRQRLVILTEEGAGRMSQDPEPVFRGLAAAAIESVARVYAWRRFFERIGMPETALSFELGPMYGFPSRRSKGDALHCLDQLFFFELRPGENKNDVLSFVAAMNTLTPDFCVPLPSRPSVPLQGARCLKYPLESIILKHHV